MNRKDIGKGDNNNNNNKDDDDDDEDEDEDEDGKFSVPSRLTSEAPPCQLDPSSSPSEYFQHIDKLISQVREDILYSPQEVIRTASACLKAVQQMLNSDSSKQQPQQQQQQVLLEWQNWRISYLLARTQFLQTLGRGGEFEMSIVFQSILKQLERVELLIEKASNGTGQWFGLGPRERVITGLLSAQAKLGLGNEKEARNSLVQLEKFVETLTPQQLPPEVQSLSLSQSLI